MDKIPSKDIFKVFNGLPPEHKLEFIITMSQELPPEIIDEFEYENLNIFEPEKLPEPPPCYSEHKKLLKTIKQKKNRVSFQQVVCPTCLKFIKQYEETLYENYGKLQHLIKLYKNFGSREEYIKQKTILEMIKKYPPVTWFRSRLFGIIQKSEEFENDIIGGD